MRFAIVILYVSALLAVSVPVFAQSGAQYLQWQRWCRGIGGTPSGTSSNPVCIPPSGVSGGGGAATYGGSSGAAMGQAIGGVLGAFIREGLFGNPQQDALRQQALAEQRRWEEQERQRLAAERARQEQERYDRLRSSLLDFNPGPQLSLLGQPSGGGGLKLMLGEDAERSTATARAEQPNVGGLQLMLGDSAEGSASPALAELTRAAAWSTLAAQATTPEDAVMFADAAFQDLFGGKINLPPPPPNVKGVPVVPLLPEIRPLKEQFLELRKAGEGAAGSVVTAEERVEYLAHLERRTREIEHSAADAARRAQAKDAALQAQRLREQAQADLASARDALKNYQHRANDAEQALRAFLSSLAATRKPDSYFYLGFEDGSQCFSQNAGSRCDKARAPTADYQTCISSYRSGYSAGEKIKQALLEEANLRGQFDREAARAYSDTDARAQGPCRYEYVMAYNRGYFSARIGLLASAPSSTRADVPPPHPSRQAQVSEVERIINGITASARRLGWTSDEQDRLKTALNLLSMEGPYDYPKIQQSWTNITGRLSSGVVPSEAARGEGPGLFGAGTQLGRNDCAIFALATAAGQPYGVVAARANRLISEGEWRSAGERANPQRVFDPSGGGLKGGEVIMLAEAFGRAEIVKPTEFAQTLRAGRPVLVNIVPSNGDTNFAHQVVLSKTFQRGKETWYEVVDSAKGPMRRLYMSAAELGFLLQENGIAYRAEARSTPDLLRAREGGR